MSKKKKLIPELRFPEFAKIADWKLKILGEVCDYWNGSSHESGVDENGEYYLISLNSIDIEGNLKSEMKRISYTDNSLQKDDLVMVLSDVAHGNFLGLTDIIPNNKYVLNQRMAGLRIKDLMLANPFFIRTFINYNQKYFKANGQGSSQLNLSKSSVTDFPILLPSIQEQQKIASCLSFLDDLISNHSQKLDLLKDHKKGLMQNLFPQEGEKVPKLRFKEFQGKWEKRFVEDFFSVGSSKRVLQKDWTIQGVPFYRTRELVSLSKNEPFGSEIFISEELFSKLSKKYGVPTEGDFLVSGVGTLGICYQVKTNDRFYFKDGNVIWFKLKKGISSTYFKFCFQSDYIQNQILKQASVSTVGTYTIQNAKKTTFWCPPTLTEQQKIASCLSSLDELIVAQAEKIEQLKQHKKGLMQGLFPKMIEHI